jgi:hypothetical protein
MQQRIKNKVAIGHWETLNGRGVTVSPLGRLVAMNCEESPWLQPGEYVKPCSAVKTG